MRLPLLFLFLLLATRPTVQAQAPTPAATSPWNIGLKLGTGANYYTNDNSNHPWSAFTGGITGGRSFFLGQVPLTLQADALFERHGSQPWQSTSANNTALFLPLYLRTGLPTTRVHFLLGAGPTVALTGSNVPESVAPAYFAYQTEGTLLAGLEVRLLPLSRYETTLALTYRGGFTPSLVHYLRSPGGTPYQDTDTHTWVGATLNVYLHPAGRAAH